MTIESLLAWYMQLVSALAKGEVLLSEPSEDAAAKYVRGLGRPLRHNAQTIRSFGEFVLAQYSAATGLSRLEQIVQLLIAVESFRLSVEPFVHRIEFSKDWFRQLDASYRLLCNPDAQDNGEHRHSRGHPSRMCDREKLLLKIAASVLVEVDELFVDFASLKSGQPLARRIRGDSRRLFEDGSGTLRERLGLGAKSRENVIALTRAINAALLDLSVLKDHVGSALEESDRRAWNARCGDVIRNLADLLSDEGEGFEELVQILRRPRAVFGTERV